MKAIAFVIMLALLAGCSPSLSGGSKQRVVVVPHAVFVEIPPELLKCFGTKYPDPSKLTDRDVARLIANLDTALKKCQSNVEAIKRWQADVQKRLG